MGRVVFLFLGWMLCMGYHFPLYAQSTPLPATHTLQPFGIKCEIVEVPFYQFSPLERQASLRMSYASPFIQNPEAWSSLKYKDYKFYEIELIYTKYPKDFRKWLTDYNWLLEHRLIELFKLDSNLLDPAIHWKIVLQTKCSDSETAKEMYHGVVIKYKPRKPWVAKIRDGYGLEMESIHKIIEGDSLPKDTMVLKALHQRKDWKKMLVIMDWTGSMYEYSAQLILWHKQNIQNDLIKHIVLFNDGDDNKFKGQNRTKEIGRTGGIYSMDVYSLSSIYSVLDKAMRAGNGGDAPENNLEAILKGLRFYSYCEEIILIADNKAPPRDMSLLTRIKRPIHIILCGTNEIPPDVNYLSIAFRTGGSLLTHKDEVRFSGNVQENIRFNLNGNQYESKDGFIVKIATP